MTDTEPKAKSHLGDIFSLQGVLGGAPGFIDRHNLPPPNIDQKLSKNKSITRWSLNSVLAKLKENVNV